MTHLPKSPIVTLSINNSLNTIALTSEYNENSYLVIHAIAKDQYNLIDGCICQDDLNIKVLDFVNKFFNKGL